MSVLVLLVYGCPIKERAPAVHALRADSIGPLSPYGYTTCGMRVYGDRFSVTPLPDDVWQIVVREAEYDRLFELLKKEGV